MIEVRGEIKISIKDTDSGKTDGDGVQWAVDFGDLDMIRGTDSVQIGAYIEDHLQHDRDVYEALLARIGDRIKLMLGEDVQLTPWPDDEKKETET